MKQTNNHFVNITIFAYTNFIKLIENVYMQLRFYINNSPTPNLMYLSLFQFNVPENLQTLDANDFPECVERL